ILHLPARLSGVDHSVLSFMPKQRRVTLVPEPHNLIRNLAHVVSELGQDEGEHKACVVSGVLFELPTHLPKLLKLPVAGLKYRPVSPVVRGDRWKVGQVAVRGLSRWWWWW